MQNVTDIFIYNREIQYHSQESSVFLRTINLSLCVGGMKKKKKKNLFHYACFPVCYQWQRNFVFSKRLMGYIFFGQAKQQLTSFECSFASETTYSAISKDNLYLYFVIGSDQILSFLSLALCIWMSKVRQRMLSLMENII